MHPPATPPPSPRPGTTRRAWILRSGVLVGALTGAGVGGAWRTRVGATPPALRPPGALGSDRRFLAACIRCAQCIAVCPEGSLHLVTRAGRDFAAPELRARDTPCTLCAGHDRLLCAETCPSGALVPIEDPRAVRIGLAELDTETCLAYQGTICRACWHACPYPDEAIRYDERLRPFVGSDVCVGCGLCERACPIEPRAIRIAPLEERGT